MVPGLSSLLAVVAELERDSVIPPPDMIKEDCLSQLLRHSRVLLKQLKTGNKLSSNLNERGSIEFSRSQPVNHHGEVDSSVLELNPLVNDRKTTYHYLLVIKRPTSLFQWHLS